MRLNDKGFLFLIGLVTVGAIWTGCAPLPDGTTDLTVESREEAPSLSLPATSEAASNDSPLASPTAVPDLSTRAVPPNETEVSIPAQAVEAVAWAQADMAAQLNLTADQISVESVEFVEWSDSSLGCPQPDMMYTQVVTPGYRIVLRGGARRHEYHSAQGRDRAVLCRTGKGYLPLPIITQPPAEDTQ